MAYIPFANLTVYRLAESMADAIWNLVLPGNRLAKDSVGKQLIRAADSVGANIAEGAGRKSFKDDQRFVRVARGSLNETRHWLRRAYQRGLMTPEQAVSLRPLIEDLAPMLNACLRSIGPTRGPEDGAPTADRSPASESDPKNKKPRTKN